MQRNFMLKQMTSLGDLPTATTYYAIYSALAFTDFGSNE